MKMHSQSRFWLALFILGGVCIIFGCQTKVKISKTPPPSVQQLAVPGGEVLENLPTAGLLPSELKGQEIFKANCATCHGKRGYGDGPLSKNLVPKPANFASLERMFQRSDEEIFEIISKGAYPSAMPPWQDVSDMTDPAERWKFVDFVRSFSYKPAKIELEEK